MLQNQRLRIRLLIVSVLTLFGLIAVLTPTAAGAVEGPPLAPNDLRTNGDQTLLLWNQPANEVDVRGWNVYANDQYITTVTASPSYALPSNASGDTYYVIAFDTRPGEPNFSPRSPEFQIPSSTQPPTTSPAPTPVPTPAPTQAPAPVADGAPLAPTNLRETTSNQIIWDQDRIPGINVNYWQIRRNGQIVENRIRTTRYNVPAAERSGVYTVQAFTADNIASPTSAPLNYGNTNTPTPTPAPADEFRSIFIDDFDGSSLDRSTWFSNTGTSVADAVNTYDQCEVSGGKLRLHAELFGSEIHSCYLSTDFRNGATNRLFGPGQDSTLRVEYEVNLSGLDAEGLWAAGWLFAHQGDNDPAYDGNPLTGTEIDVFEYIPYVNADDPTGFDRTNHIHPAVHSDQTGNSVLPQQFGADNGYIGMDQFGIDVRDNRWHTIAIEWNRDCQVYSIDGNPFWFNQSRVSPAESHAIMLTLEASGAGENGFNSWGRPIGDINENVRTQNSYFDVNRVEVFEKNSIDSNLCG